VDFISKPINPQIVRARVRAHLTLKAQSDLLRQWAYIDGLTGVHNRRHFDERLAAEWELAARDGSALSIILIDVDLFKRYNDGYGHQAGDDCLRSVAAALQGQLERPRDLLARYGGEEFVCLLPETPLAGALAQAEQLRMAVHALHIEHRTSSVAPVVTVSLGVSSKPISIGGSAAALLREADAQLYRAKSLGRHQVCAAELAAN
jgi:diguanylate cyclase (GGDEF)-like protein